MNRSTLVILLSIILMVFTQISIDFSPEAQLFYDVQSLTSDSLNITRKPFYYEKDTRIYVNEEESLVLLKLGVGQSNFTHIWVVDPTNQTEGYWIERGSGYQELNSSRGQSFRHFYNSSSKEFTFQSSLLVQKASVLSDTDWVTVEEYPHRYILRLTNGTIKQFETPGEISGFISLIDNSTIWGIGYESFSGVMGFYLNFQDSTWGHGQYLYYPRLLDGKLPSYDQPLYAMYPHLYANYLGTWYDKILNDRSMYSQPYQNPRNTLHFFNSSDSYGLYFTTPNITIFGTQWDFKHGFKYNFTDQLYHQITEFRCLDTDFDDIGIAYEITSAPQSDGTPYQPDRFRLSNGTYEREMNISELWNAGTILNDYYSRIEIVSQNNEIFVFDFVDMERAGFGQKYLELHDQVLPDGNTRKILKAGMYGYGSYLNGSWIKVDPSTGTVYSTDNFDVVRLGSGTWDTTSNFYAAGYNGGTNPNIVFIAFDTGINVEISGTSSVSLAVYVWLNELDASEYIDLKVYNIVGSGDGANSNTGKENSQSYSDGTNSIANNLYDSSTPASQYVSKNVETQTDYWGTYRGDSENYISFRWYEGGGGDSGDFDGFRVADSSSSGTSNDPYISFSYTVPTAPDTPTYQSGMANTYGGKNTNTLTTRHTDGDGQADVDDTRIRLGNSVNYFELNYNVDTTTTTEIGSSGWVSAFAGTSASGVTNGYDVTWSFTVDWDFPFDDTDFDLYMWTDDEGGLTANSGWVEAGTTTHEDDMIFTDQGAPDWGWYLWEGTGVDQDDDGVIEEGEWIGTYVDSPTTLQVQGYISYEGTNTGVPTDACDVELFVNGTWTNEGDQVLGVQGWWYFEYSLPSAEGLFDSDYDFDVRMVNFTTGASEGAGGLTTYRNAKLDNVGPTGYSISLIEDSNSGTGYDPNTNYYDDNSVNVSVSGSASDGSGVGLATTPYVFEIDNVGSWQFGTTKEFTSVSDANHTLDLLVKDVLGNNGSESSEWVIVDVDAPSGFTLTWTDTSGIESGDYAYLSGSTLYFNSGENQEFWVEINNDGQINNSAFWKIIWDVNAVFHGTATIDYSSVPYDMNFPYFGDSSGTFAFRLVNNAGNYLEWSYTATEDATSPSGYTLSLIADTNSGTGYVPDTGYYDDSTIDVDATDSGSITETGSGLSTNPYTFNSTATSWITFQASDTWTTPSYGDGAYDIWVMLRDWVGNNGTPVQITVGTNNDVIIDTSNPSGFSHQFSTTHGYLSPWWDWAYNESSNLYFNPNPATGYDLFGSAVMNDGNIGNSGYWKVIYDVNSVFDPTYNYTSPLPSLISQDFEGDFSGTYIIRLLNHAGNYQEFSWSAIADSDSPTAIFSKVNDSGAFDSGFTNEATILSNVTSASDGAGSGLLTNYLRFQDDVSGGWGGWYSTNQSFNLNAQSNNTLRVLLTDKVGNNNTYVDYVFLDQIDPILGWLTLNESYAPNWYDQSQSSTAQAHIYWTEAYPYQVIATCSLTHTNDLNPSGGVSLINFTLTGVNDGSYSVSITIWDKAGNSDTTLVGSEAPIQIENNMAQSTQTYWYYFYYFDQEGFGLQFSYYNTTYILDENFIQNPAEVQLRGIAWGRIFLNQTSTVRIITRDYFENVVFNSTFTLLTVYDKFINLNVNIFKVSNAGTSIINLTISLPTSESVFYSEQVMPNEIFSFRLYATVYNVTGLAHNTSTFAVDSSNNTLNDYQIDMSTDIAIFILATVDSICSIIIVDQSNFFLDPRMFKIYVDGSRIYGDTFLWTDTSASKNITIIDIFDNLLYQDLTASHSRFLDVVLTLYSIKIQNLQPDPVWITFKRGSKTFSEWVFSGEVIEYRIEADTYNLTVYYASFTGNIGNAATNGTTATYQWSVSSDNAIVVSGNTIADIFGNTQDLLGNLNSVNTTLHDQILNINLSISNDLVSIDNQIVNVDISLDNVNSSIQTELTNIDTAISNLNSFVTIQFTDINTTILQINSTLFSQTNSILSNITNVNSTLYSQTLTILSNIANMNSTLYTQAVSIMSDIANTNATLYSQMINVIAQVNNYNSSVIAQILNVYAAINNIEPADPEIVVTPTPVTIDDDDFVKQNRNIQEDITFAGSLLAVTLFLVIILLALRLIKPKEFQVGYVRVKKEGGKFVEAIENERKRFYEL